MVSIGGGGCKFHMRKKCRLEEENLDPKLMLNWTVEFVQIRFWNSDKCLFEEKKNTLHPLESKI